MREYKDIIHTAGERAIALALVEDYRKDAAVLNRTYFEFHDKLFAEFQEHGNWLKYMLDRKPTWDKHKARFETIWSNFVINCRQLGYEIGSE